MEEKHIKRYNGLDLYDIELLEEVDGMVRISLVDDPAVESEFLKFTSDLPVLTFQRDEMEQRLTGVAIRADRPIYRRDGDYEYYVKFSKETIKQIVERYSKDGFFNKVDLQHDGKEVSGVYMVELYQKDTERGINPKGFEDIEDGSLFVTYKVTDSDLWQQIMDTDEFNGFSIEIYATPVPSTYRKEEDEMFTIDMETLTADFSKKKERFSVADELAKAMESEQVVDITVDGNRTLENAQIYQIGKENGKSVAVIYGKKMGYDSNQWYVIETKRLSNVRPSMTPFVEWNTARQGASWQGVEDLLDTEDIQSIKSAVVPQNEYERAIMERKVCIITYRDASEEDCTASRQCFVGEYGFNYKGNAALRAYQYYGSTHTESEGWKMFLLSRILSFQVLDYMEPVTIPPEGFNLTGPDRDNFDCILRAQFD